MFDFLKKKFSKLVENFSKKVEKKEEEIKNLEKDIEKKESVLLEKEPREIIEEIKETIEFKAPETKEKVEEIVKEIKSEGLPEKPKKSWIKKISEKIVKSLVVKKLTEEDINPILDELETDLIESDVAFEVVEKIKNDLKNSLVNKEIERGKEKEIVKSAIKQSLTEILSVPKIDLKEKVKLKKPFVILFIGFNGNGKTSSIAKVAKWILENNYSCVISASDCFRAAAIDQIQEHANKLGVRLIKHNYGADPAAVAFDAISHAKANGIDFVLIDTAGRTHTNINLMNEMQKIVRVSKPDLKVLVIDSLVGNDAVSQAKMFNDSIGIDAVIFTKLDINPKGGAILSVSYLLKKPILFLTTGQDYSDLKEFDKDWFINQLLTS